MKRKMTIKDGIIFVLAIIALAGGIISLLDGRLFAGLFWTIAGIVVIAQRIRDLQGKDSKDSTGKRLATTENVLVTIFLLLIFLIMLFATIVLITSIKQPLDTVFPAITAILAGDAGVQIYRDWTSGR